MTVSCFGFNDRPTNEDLVNVEKYLNGLAQFVAKCQTPMTIAIQGDWGTGKTSAMSSLKRELDSSEGDYWQIDFNTWQYSQFDLGDRLVFSLIGTILAEIEGKIPDAGGRIQTSASLRKLMKKLRRAVGAGARQLAVSGADLVLPGFGEVPKEAFSAYSQEVEVGSKTEEVPGPDQSIALLSTLRRDLEELVHKVCNAQPENEGFQGPSRIVVYIDDLDRLEPKRAILVMEAIKIFLDIEGCVFVLAIDFDVVLRGVREKYGEDFGEDKARAFFDKIIQVPFNLPTGAYEVTDLLETGLKSVNVEISESDASYLEKLLRNSTGTNPRSIKRLINTFGLIKTIGLDRESTDKSGRRTTARDIHIFAILCLQAAFPEVFRSLNRSFATRSLTEVWEEINSAATSDDEGSSEQLESWGLKDYRKESFAKFIEQTNALFSPEPHSSTFDEDLFKDALAKSAITAVGTDDLEGMQSSKGFRASALSPLDERVEELRKSKPNGAELGKVFEETLLKSIEGVEAGATPKYWSYRAPTGSGMPTRIEGKRFLELHHMGYGFRLYFGKYLSRASIDKAISDVRSNCPHVEVSLNEESVPPCSVKNVTTKKEAETLARIVGNAYLYADA